MRDDRALTPQSCVKPDRELFAALYRLLKTDGAGPENYEVLCRKLGDNGSGIAAVMIAVKALKELGVVVRDQRGFLSINGEAQKVNLEDAPILQRKRWINGITGRKAMAAEKDKDGFLHLRNLLKKSFQPAEIELIEKAYELACEAHGGQLRYSGQLYISHPFGLLRYLPNSVWTSINFGRVASRYGRRHTSVRQRYQSDLR
jgi:hypothetical protein